VPLIPLISGVTMTGISGTANPGDVIELFEHNTTGCATAPCQGKTFLGSATTDAAGIWYVGGPFPIGMSITATATDAQGNTSEFSLCNVVDALLDGQQTVEEELTKQTAPRQISLSPNPTQGICQLSWPYEGSVRLRLLNPKGQTILTEQVETEIYYKQLDLSHLAKGIYTVEVMSSFGERQSLRLIRQ
ncbi:MAG: T9SS type A sorting domain-containing protein, partial [Bacteroidota bacterium]